MSRPVLHMLFGMARSGTTFLARALEMAPGVAVFGESDFFGRSYRRPAADGLYHRRDLAAIVAVQSSKEWASTTGDHGHPLARLAPGTYPRLVAEALDDLRAATPAQTFAAIAEAVARSTGCSTVIEKTPGHLLFVDRVADALPGIRCVASWREPIGFVRSFLAMDRHDRRASARLLGRVSRHTATAVLMWRSYTRALQRARLRLGPRLLVVSHEQLRLDPKGTVARAALHLGIEPPAAELGHLSRNASADPGAPPPTDLELWLRLLARDLGPGTAARAALPRTPLPRALRSLVTAAPASALLAARVLPRIRDRRAYVRRYLGQDRSR